MNLFLQISIVLAGGIINWAVRGGGVKLWFPRFRGSKIINALLFGLAWWYAHSPQVGAGMALAMAAGQAPAIFDKSSDVAKNAGNISDWMLIVFERSFVWCVPIVLVMYLAGINIIYILPALLLMPLCYSTIWWMRPVNGWLHPWSVAEFTYGLLLWLPLAMV